MTLVGHDFHLINKLEEPIHIASVRTSAGFLTPRIVVNQHAASDSAWIAPHQSAKIHVQIDTRRFTGGKTATVYVQFEKPSPAEVQLQVQAYVEYPPGAAMKAAPEESKARIQELELKVDELLKQMESLRKELKQPSAKPSSGSSRIEAIPGNQIQRHVREPEGTDPAKP
jgi:hypothetical protein